MVTVSIWVTWAQLGDYISGTSPARRGRKASFQVVVIFVSRTFKPFGISGFQVVFGCLDYPRCSMWVIGHWLEFNNQFNVLKCNRSVIMRQKGDLSDFERGTVVCAGLAGIYWTFHSQPSPWFVEVGDQRGIVRPGGEYIDSEVQFLTNACYFLILMLLFWVYSHNLLFFSFFFTNFWNEKKIYFLLLLSFYFLLSICSGVLADSMPNKNRKIGTSTHLVQRWMVTESKKSDNENYFF